MAWKTFDDRLRNAPTEAERRRRWDVVKRFGKRDENGLMRYPGPEVMAVLKGWPDLRKFGFRWYPERDEGFIVHDSLGRLMEGEEVARRVFGLLVP